MLVGGSCSYPAKNLYALPTPSLNPNPTQMQQLRTPTALINYVDFNLGHSPIESENQDIIINMRSKYLRIRLQFSVMRHIYTFRSFLFWITDGRDVVWAINVIDTIMWWRNRCLSLCKISPPITTLFTYKMAAFALISHKVHNSWSSKATFPIIFKNNYLCHR